MKGIAILFLLILQHGLFAQKANTVATIDNVSIGYEELMYAYQKNRDTSQVLSYDSLRIYLDQYIDFKLKVLAAYDLGLDQSSTFQEELESYVSQVKKPYLQNPELEEAKLKSIYKRLGWEVNAAHILLKLGPMATPSDTLLAYTKLDSIRSLVTSVESFESLAKANSQDGSARRGGDLGWFTAFHMVGPFEDAAYALEVGEVSPVFRTQFGYHIMILKNKRPTRGRLRASHIYFAKSIHGNEVAKQKAQIFYDSIRNGASWELIAKSQSDDKRTSNKGGLLPLAGIRQLPDDFFSEIYKLKKIGDISEPFQTSTGWHIAKLEEVEPLFAYEFKKEEIAHNLKRSGRNELTTQEVVQNLKINGDFQQNIIALNEQIDMTMTSDREPTNERVFTYEGVDVRWFDFLKGMGPFDKGSDLRSDYEKFQSKRILEIEDSIAPTKYPDYGYLLQEFEEGLLLFEIMQQNIWNPAAQDSLGLSNHYNNNKENYSELAFTGELLSTKNKNAFELFDQLRNEQKFNRGNIASRFSGSELKIVKSTISAREIPNFNDEKTKENTWILVDDNRLMFVESIKKNPLSLDQSKGLVIADYQEHLEEIWVADMRANRKIKVYEKKLKKLINQ